MLASDWSMPHLAGLQLVQGLEPGDGGGRVPPLGRLLDRLELPRLRGAGLRAPGVCLPVCRPPAAPAPGPRVLVIGRARV